MFRKDFLKNLQPIYLCTISLRNGSEAIGLEEGSVCLGANFTVDNVSFVLELKCNLISLGQFMCDTGPYL